MLVNLKIHIFCNYAKYEDYLSYLHYIAINANNYKIDQKYKSQLEMTANGVSNSVLVGRKNLKRKHKDMVKLPNTAVDDKSSSDDEGKF